MLNSGGALACRRPRADRQAAAQREPACLAPPFEPTVVCVQILRGVERIGLRPVRRRIRLDWRKERASCLGGPVEAPPDLFKVRPSFEQRFDPGRLGLGNRGIEAGRAARRAGRATPLAASGSRAGALHL